jgi:hypothetical protein
MRTDNYETKRERIESVQLTPANELEVARWTGGKIVNNVLEMYVESGTIIVGYTDYVCRDTETGQFFAMHPDKFEAKYHKTGVREGHAPIGQGETERQIRETRKEWERINGLANLTLKGFYGNGYERKQRLGSDYDAVQGRVNELVYARHDGQPINRSGARRV